MIIDKFEIGGADLNMVTLKIETEVEDVDAVALCLLIQVVNAGRTGRMYKHLLPQLHAALIRSPAVRQGITSSLTKQEWNRHDWD